MTNTFENQSIQALNSNELKVIFGENNELALFFVTWLKNGRNATKSYQELHPGVEYNSAKTLGSRIVKELFTKVDLSILLGSYDLGYERFLKQLEEGLNCPDHKTKFLYFQSLASLLGLEIKSNPKASSEEAWRNVEILPSSWYKSDITTTQNEQNTTNANALAK